MLKRILIPVDMSGCSLAALRYGAFLAEHSGAELYVLHVAHSFEGAVDSAEQLGGSGQAQAGAASIRDFLQDPGRAVIKEAHVEVICGDVSQAILRAASQHGVDIIVMGSHGARESRGAIVGHVVSDVANLATCPVVPVFESFDGPRMYSLTAPKRIAQSHKAGPPPLPESGKRPVAGVLRGVAADGPSAHLPTRGV